MKNFRFKAISLLSEQSRKAKYQTFHNRKNLIVGGNHTGKSTLIKNLFITLGAKPKGDLREWEETAVSAVDFEVDGANYTAIHSSGIRALFDGKNDLLLATSSRDKWQEAFSKAVGFNLVLNDKNQSPIEAHLSTFFLPFYINQDGSWQSDWATFPSVKQYKSPYQTILEYFSGIRPPQYYKLLAEKQEALAKMSDLTRELRFLEKAKKRLGNSLPLYSIKLDDDSFQNDVLDLTREVTQLNEKQENLREKSVKEREMIADIVHQVVAAKEALKTFYDDRAYINRNPEPLICPTCNAVHEQQFLDVLHYSEDARVLEQMIFSLKNEEEKLRSQSAETNQHMSSLAADYTRLTELLETKRGNVEFRDFIDALGGNAALKAFHEEYNELDVQINEINSIITNKTIALKELTDKKRSKAILDLFRKRYADALIALHTTNTNMKQVKLTTRPQLSGSGGPRSILAYYSAIWAVALSEHGSFNIPLVIDSPNQQAQDNVNLPTVLKFIANNLPSNAQIIVGSEIDSQEPFDEKIVLDTPYHILNVNDYAAVESRLRPMLSTVFKSLVHHD